MAKSWYLSLNGRELGPLPSEQVQRMAARGQIKPETLIRPETQEQWLPAETWPQLFACDKAAPAAAPVLAATKRPSGTVPRAKAVSTSSQPVASPPTGTVPRGVPAGVAVTAPVGIPAGVAAKVPVGAAVQAAPSPSASGFPPVIVTDNPTGRTKTAIAKSSVDDEPTRGKKSRTPVLVLGGAAVAIAIIGGIVVIVNPFAQGTKKAEVAATNSLAAATKGSEADPNAAEGEAPVSGEAKAGAVAPASKAADKGSASPSSAKAVSNKDIEELKKKVKSWKTASAGYKVGSLQYQVTNVWLANDAADEAPAEKQVTATAADSDKAASKPKHLFVQVVLKNTGATPLAYRGWNGFSAKDTAAVLLGDENAPLPLAPASEAASDRLKSVSIAPQSAITDTLVFAAPSEETETLRLMLPKIAITGVGSGVFALEIPSAMITRERPAESVLAGASNSLAGKPAAKESEFERERRLLSESLGGEPENKPNEPKPKEPATSKGTPDAEMPADDKPGAAKSENKDAKPAEPDLKSLINGIEKKGEGNPKPDKEKGAE